MLIKVTISGEFTADDDDTLASTAQLVAIAGTLNAFELKDEDGVNLVDLGVIPVSVLNVLAAAAEVAGFPDGRAKVIYARYVSGAATEFSASAAIDLGSTMTSVGPTLECAPTTDVPAQVGPIGLPIDHALQLRSDVSGAQTIFILLEPVATDVELEDALAVTADDDDDRVQPVATGVIVASGSTVQADTWQSIDATAGAISVTMPGTVAWTYEAYKGTRAGLIEVGGSVNVVTVSAGAFADYIQDPDTLELAATATLDVAYLSVGWQLVAVGSDTVWMIDSPLEPPPQVTKPTADAAVAITRRTGGLQLRVTTAANVAITTTSAKRGQLLHLFALSVAGGGSYTLALDVGTLTLNATGESAVVMRTDADAWMCVGLSGATIV
jgi:hypothetical protein